MDDVVEFLRRFIEAHHAVLIARNGDTDPVFKEKQIALQTFLSDEEPLVLSGITRPPKMKPADLAKMKSRRTGIARMKLFLVRTYKDKKLGELFRGYLSGTQKGVDDEGYVYSVFVKNRAEGLKIVSRYAACLDCAGTSKLVKKTCPACGGFAWTNSGGHDVARTLGRPLAARKLVAPSEAASLARCAA